jgi:hypothetical protein
LGNGGVESMSRPLDYAHVSTHVLTHPKFVALLDEGGGDAFVGWMALVSWARDNCDPFRPAEAGVINEAIARRTLRGAVEVESGYVLELLEKHRLLDPMLTGEWQIHDFAEHQHLEEWRRRLERSARGNAARWGDSSSSPQGDPQGIHKESPNPTQPREDQTSSAARTSGPHRIPPDFAPDEVSVKLIERKRPDVDWRAETARFVGYWQAKPGKAGEKRNWQTTWVNWMSRSRGQGRSPDDEGGIPPWRRSDDE